MFFFFFFKDPAPPEISPLPLPAALPIYVHRHPPRPQRVLERLRHLLERRGPGRALGELRLEKLDRSEEHTSELQSLAYLVCRLLLEKKKRRPPTSARLTSHLCWATGPSR